MNRRQTQMSLALTKRILTQTENEILNETEKLILEQIRRYATKFKSGAMQLRDCDALQCLMATADRVFRMRVSTKPETSDDTTEATASSTERNMNWAVLVIPEGCHSVFVCMDGGLFDERVKNGMVPLHDGRYDASVPCFIAASPVSDPQHLGIVATESANPVAEPNTSLTFAEAVRECAPEREATRGKETSAE